MKIDRTAIFEKIKASAQKHLSDIDESRVELFAIDVKNTVEIAFEKFVISQEQCYMEDPLLAIKDTNQLLRFSDVKNGYRRLMQDWVDEHPIEAKRNDVDINSLPMDIPFTERESIRRSMTTFGLGSVAVVGLRFLTGTCWLYLGEIAVLALSHQQYRKGMEVDKVRLAELKEANRLHIENVIKQGLNNWLDEAEKYNKEVLDSFIHQ